MTITLYRNNSEPNRLDKSLSTIIRTVGDLRGESSVLSPSILIQGNAEIASCNYMHIDEFGRYYFVDDIVSVRNGIWMISGHVDVLYTYRAGIRSQNAIIARQQYDYNLYLNDDKFLVNSNRMSIFKAFPNRASTGGSSMVLTLAGGAKSSS